MAPKQVKITAKDLASRNPSPAAKKALDIALKHAYEDQERLLKQAARIKD